MSDETLDALAGTIVMCVLCLYLILYFGVEFTWQCRHCGYWNEPARMSRWLNPRTRCAYCLKKKGFIP